MTVYEKPRSIFEKLHIKRPKFLVPFAASLIAFLFVMLAFFGGNQPNVLENFDIITFNTSELGKALLNNPPIKRTPTGTVNARQFPGGLASIAGAIPSVANTLTGEAGQIASTVKSILPSLTSEIGSAATSALAAAESAVKAIENDIANELASVLGIHQFYSLHILAVCEGFFTPNATSSGAAKNTTGCSERAFVKNHNVSAMIDLQLNVGPFNLNLADLGFVEQLQDKMDDIHRMTEAFAVMFVVAVAFTGFSMLASSLFPFIELRSSLEHIAVLVNTCSAGFAAAMLLINATLITAGAYTVVNAVNDLGQDVGLSASTGSLFYGFTWTSTILMLISFAFWFFHCGFWTPVRAYFLEVFGRAKGRGTSGSQKFEADRTSEYGASPTWDRS